MFYKDKSIWQIAKKLMLVSIVFLLVFNLFDFGFEFTQYTITFKNVMFILFYFFIAAVIDIVGDLYEKRKKSKLDSNFINP